MIDFPKIIAALHAKGVSYCAQAQHCNKVTEGTVRNWRDGRMPKHPEGERLKELFVREFPDREIPSLS